ncbi:MAG: 8-amino-7-oxononanoate synthase [Pseudomonadota bacterium]
MAGFDQRLRSRLASRHQDLLYRQRLTVEGPQGPEVTVGGETLLNFCSNDYLGLAAHPKLAEALREGARRYGVGSGASHLVCGHGVAHHALEDALAEHTGRSRALLFSSGYMANIGTLGALLETGDLVLEDRLNHASLLDGGLASGARFKRFAHNDTEAAASQLAAHEGNALLVVDGVFSMDGDMAPLPALAALCGTPKRWLMVDDAHGFGVFGATGAGSLEAAGLDEAQAPVLMATLGKALGTAGAFVAGSDTLIDALIQSARNYIYTTALPPALAWATLCSLRLLVEEAWRREHLFDLVAYFRKAAGQLDLPLMPARGAIQPLSVGDSGRALALSSGLRERGILVTAIRPPTVPAGTARLRITLTAAHSRSQVDRLLMALAEVAGGE